MSAPVVCVTGSPPCQARPSSSTVRCRRLRHGLIPKAALAKGADTVKGGSGASAPLRAPPADDVIARLRAVRAKETHRFGERAYDVLYTPASQEVAGPLEVLYGQVPSDFPDGAYFRNGPNHPFYDERGDDHIFDADGMVHAAVFKGGSGQYFNRYVNTDTHALEQKAGGRLFGGVMVKSGYRMLLNLLGNRLLTGTTFKKTANTGLLFFNGRLLALMEASMPYEMRLTDGRGRLQTMPDVYDFEGQLNHPMTAHPKVCPKTGEVMCFGYQADAPPHMLYSVFSPTGQKLFTQEIDLPKPVMTHDMAITENYTILLDLPLVFDTANIIRNRFPFAYDATHPARIGLLRRHGGPVEWFNVESCNAFHTVNAYEDKASGEVVLHAGRYMCEKDSYFEFNPAYLYEWRLRPGSGGQSKTERLLDRTPMEYPKINNEYTGLEYRYCYGVEPTSMGKTQWAVPSDGVSFSAVLKYDVQRGTVVDSWRPDDGTVFGELEFVPRMGSSHSALTADGSRSAEDDGYLVTFGTDVSKGHSFAAIFDAASVGQGPVALLKTPQPVPLGLHGTWVPCEDMKDVMNAWF